MGHGPRAGRIDVDVASDNVQSRFLTELASMSSVLDYVSNCTSNLFFMSRTSSHHHIITSLIFSFPTAALHYRTVRIFTPTKTTIQSGKQGNGHWRIDFDVLEGGGRWENPLMGWGSS